MKKLIVLVLAMMGTVYSSTSYAYKQCSNEAKMFTPNTTMGAIQSTIKFNNASTKSIKIYWLSFTGERTLYKTLAPAGVYSQKTYLTAPWVVTDLSDNCKGVYFPDGQLRTVKVVK